MTASASEQAIIVELSRTGISVKRQRALLSRLRKEGTQDSVPVLQSYLSDEDEQSQARAVLALAQIGTEDAAEALLRCLKMSPGPRFTLAASRLATLAADRAVPCMVRALEKRADQLPSGDKRLLIETIATRPHRSYIPILSRMLIERSWRVRLAAARAIANTRSPESRLALETARDSSPWTRSLAPRWVLWRMRGHFEQ